MNRFKFHFPYILLAVVLAIVVWSNVPIGGGSHAPVMAQDICPPCGMEVDPRQALHARLNGRTHYFCAEGCRTRFLEGEKQVITNHDDGRSVDVVCNMEVNPSWQIETQYKGKTYHFCNQRCLERFNETPERFLSTRCMVCDKTLDDDRSFPATYLGKTYHLCSDEHRAEFKADPAACFMHTMWGIPTWLYYVSIAAVMIVSFGVFDWITRKSRDESVHSQDEPTRRSAAHH